MTYDETLDAIAATANTTLQLEYIATLPGIRGSENPSYEKGLQTIAIVSDTVVKEALTSEIYTFVKVESNTEVYDVFSYITPDYIAANPGIKGNTYSSYVGIYFSETGERTE